MGDRVEVDSELIEEPTPEVTLKAELTNPIQAGLSERVTAEAESKLIAQLTPQIKATLKVELREQVKEELRNELRQEVHDNLIAETRRLHGHNVKRELVSFLKPQVEAELRGKLIDDEDFINKVIEDYRVEYLGELKGLFFKNIAEALRQELLDIV